MRLPAWVQADDVPPLVEELLWLRARGVWGVRDLPAPTKELLGIARRISGQVDGGRSYDLLLGLFRDEVLPGFAVSGDLPADAVALYFGLDVESRTKSSRWRRETTGRRFFHQSWTQFRRDDVGAEKFFLLSLAQFIADLDNGSGVGESTSARSLDSSDETVSRLDTICHRLYQRHPLILVVGTRSHALELTDAQLLGVTGELLDVIRRLTERNVVSSVISTGADLAPHLADLLMESREQPPASARALWQPLAGARDLERAICSMASITQDHYGRCPTVLAIGLSPGERATLSGLARRWEAAATGEDLLILDETGTSGSAVKVTLASPLVFLCQLEARTSQDWLVWHCRRLDFSQHYTAASILRGDPVRPGIVTSGMWASSVPAAGPPSGRTSRPQARDIAGGSGTGKTALAFHEAWQRNADEAFYIDLAEVAEVDDDGLRRLLVWMETKHQGGVLIVDNTQAASIKVQELNRQFGMRAVPRIHLITIKTTPPSFMDVLVGEEVREKPIRGIPWADELSALVDWVTASDSGLAWPAQKAAETAQNIWHFFYLLRGGADSLVEELRETRERELADVVWFAIAASQVFHPRRPGFRDLFQLVGECGLWPLTIPAGDRGRWLAAGLDYLVRAGRIVAATDGFICRHPLDAAGVVRISCEHSSQLTERDFLDVVVRLFRKALRPLSAAPLSGDPRELTRLQIQQFARGPLSDKLVRQLELELAVPYDDRLAQYVTRVWAEVLALIETWPLHELYWLVSASQLTDAALKFPPFRGLRRLAAIQTVSCESDAIDIVYLIRAILGFDALRVAQKRWAFSFYIERELLSLMPPGKQHHFKELVAKLIYDDSDGLNVSVFRSLVSDPAIVSADQARSKEEFVHRNLAGALNERRKAISKAVRSFDTQALLDSMQTLVSARPLLLIHIWLLSPEKGIELFREMPVTWRAEVVTALMNSYSRRSQFWLDEDDYMLAQFVYHLAPSAPELMTWASSEIGSTFGSLITAIEDIQSPAFKDAPDG